MEILNNDFNREQILEKVGMIIDSFNSLFNESLDKFIDEWEKQTKKKTKKLPGRHKELYDFEDELLSDYNIDKFYEYRDTIYEEWKISPKEELGKVSASDFINNINDFDLLIEIFLLFAVKGDYDEPEFLLQKLYSFGDKAVDRILDFALDKSLLSYKDSEENYLISLSSIKALGEWKEQKAITPLINFLLNLPDIISEVTNNENNCDEKSIHMNSQCNEINKFDKHSNREDCEDCEDYENCGDCEEYEKDEMVDLFGEVIRDALVSIGENAIRPLIDILTNTNEYGEPHEYLAMALADIGKDNRSDEIYRCLKKMFLKYDKDKKNITSDCLAVYGDGRAIPALRGYIEKNLDRIDEDIFYAVKIAIDKLGGNMDDIVFYKMDNDDDNDDGNDDDGDDYMR
ncbi:MAG TPA: hypothetical protein PK733_11995 [Clostridiales bacterium]|nr:hypothetical protein [Clostridiales bacterium]